MRLSPDRRRKVDEWYMRRFLGPIPSALLRMITLPVGRQLRTDASRHESAQMIHTAMAFVSNERVEGDYLEFGVFRGRSFVEAWHAASYWKRVAMRFVAFDSFAGLPELGDVDAGGPFRQADYRASRDEFEATLRQHRVPPSRVSVVEGLFEQTLDPDARTTVGVRQAAVAVIDCDLYASTVLVLDFLTDLLVDGSVLIFDDWYTFKGRPDRGEQRATAEWLRRNPRLRLVPYRSFSWSGQSFIVNTGG
jgi:hypothetical protein